MVDVPDRPEPSPDQAHVDEMQKEPCECSAKGRELGVLVLVLTHLGYVDDLDAEDHLADTLAALSLNDEGDRQPDEVANDPYRDAMAVRQPEE